MRLPPIDNRPAEWPRSVIDVWSQLRERAASMESAAGNSDAFERMIQRFREMARTGRFDGLVALLKRRMAARALSSLWATDREYGLRLLNDRILDALIAAQQPRLTRLTLVQLLQLYFGLFDELDTYGKQSETSLRHVLQGHIEEQLTRLPLRRQQSIRKDIISVLGEHPWLLELDAPLRLVQLARSEGRDFNDAISAYGLDGFDGGRYGDICRAHYYLETLRSLYPGEHDPVLDELLKPSVAKAPYQGEKRIGHAALEIMIDRVADEPGDVWQNFIISLAGDPRIANSAPAYREWWQPLGAERIAKVRGWLSREDLRLFLQAVEQYGIESDNDDLQRMFPARKLFLEGLFKLKLIRNTRLLLGHRAEQSVRRILGKEVRTSFAKMDGVMTDKAVIYLDCGDFHLVEGSHSFKIWVYLAPPSDLLTSYQRSSFSHSDLTTKVPGDYRRTYPSLPCDAFVHTPHTWQYKVFSFLADNGIGLDMEQLLSPADYKNQLQRFGIPTVNPRRTIVPAPVLSRDSVPDSGTATSLASDTADTSTQLASRQPPRLQPGSGQQQHAEAPPKARPDREPGISLSEPKHDGSFSRPAGTVATPRGKPGGMQSNPASFTRASDQLSSDEIAILKYCEDNPGDLARYAANTLGLEAREINALLHGALRRYAVQDRKHGWSMSRDGLRYCEALQSTVAHRLPVQELLPRISDLTAAARRVLRTLSVTPVSELKMMAAKFGVRAVELELILEGPLDDFCVEWPEGFWSITPEAQAALHQYDQQELI